MGWTFWFFIAVIAIIRGDFEGLRDFHFLKISKEKLKGEMKYLPQWFYWIKIVNVDNDILIKAMLLLLKQ